MATMNEEVKYSLDGPVEPITPEQATHVERLVHQFARDDNERDMFMDMLGLRDHVSSAEGVAA